MILSWLHVGPVALAAFFASLVECTEAMTVVLAVGAVRGWRGAFAGSFAAVLFLLLLVLLLGPALARTPLPLVHALVGILLLLFGMRWLGKAILRTAGALALRSETAVYARARQALEKTPGHAPGWDGAAIVAAFKITLIEGLEVVFIVITLGAAGRGFLASAAVGALAALLVVLFLGLLLRRPVASIPENTLKLIVGILMTGFGTFWVGEGMGLAWPGEDWSLVALCLGYAALVLLVVERCRASHAPVPSNHEPRRQVRNIAHRLASFIVDDWRLAIELLAWLAVVWLAAPYLAAPGIAACIALFVGVSAILAESSLRHARERTARS